MKINIFSIFRKHSSGDLHSRLKTRKLLGVGETDDGDVHRSKVSHFKSLEYTGDNTKISTCDVEQVSQLAKWLSTEKYGF